MTFKVVTFKSWLKYWKLIPMTNCPMKDFENILMQRLKRLEFMKKKRVHYRIKRYDGEDMGYSYYFRSKFFRECKSISVDFNMRKLGFYWTWAFRKIIWLHCTTSKYWLNYLKAYLYPPNSIYAGQTLDNFKEFLFINK